MSKFKKVLSWVLVVALTAGASIAGTMAYLTKDVGTKVNTFNVGGLDVVLTEEVDVITNGGGTFSSNQEGGADYIDLMPGDKITKKVTLTNTGDEDTYVRVTVTLNNADKINAAIDEVYEGKGYTKEAVQAMYDYIFDGWYINYNPRPGAEGVNDARGVIDGTYGLPEHVLKVDFAKTTDYDNDTFMFGINNWFQNELEKNAAASGAYSTHPAKDGYYTSQLVDGDATDDADERDYVIVYTYYIDLPEGESTTLFNGLNIPEEFDADQLAMFDGLTIDIDADAIQKANFATVQEAFEVLMNGGETIVKLVTNEEELMAAAEKGGHIILKDNITLTDVNGVNFTKDTILNLNGYNLTAAGDAIVVTSGTLTIDGEGVVTAADGGSYCAVWANGGHVVINDGTYVGSSDAEGVGNDTIYTKNGGTVIINGGEYFADKNSESYGATQYTCLNENDANRGTITVTGGTFHRFSPAYNWSEGKGTNFLAEGYKTFKKTVDGHGVYEVYNASIADTWDGTADTSWYNENATTFTLATAEQLAGLSELVDGGNTFSGKTIKLDRDLNLDAGWSEENNEPVSFDPIGDSQNSFDGIFDGQGHTIENMFEGGWALGHDWYNYGSIGLFGSVNDATVKNVTISGAENFVEGGDVGGITGSATGDCTFENITIANSTFATYNNGNGGIIGWAGEGNYTFKDITIAEDVVLAGFWGSFDSSIGGIMGQLDKNATANFENVNVACRLDVYNDVTASYKWYSYRMCGMLIGRVLEVTQTESGSYIPNPAANGVTCENVTVTYNDWANYHYLWDDNINRGCQRVEAGYSYGGVDTTQYPNGEIELIEFDQIFGGPQSGKYGYYGLAEYDGVTVIYNNK